MDPIERLTTLFQKFPGIGPRQAQRFVQYLLRTSPAVRREIMESIRELGSEVAQCPSCQRYHSGKKDLCSICGNPERDASLLAIVASDADLAALERSHMFRGKYFVLGGLLSLASDRMTGLRIKELLDSLPKRRDDGLSEVILAFPANPEGDSTAIRVKEEIQENVTGITISMLGRGLSTGSELEYADPETLRSAFDNRR
jgi:recombination protein RecR